LEIARKRRPRMTFGCRSFSGLLFGDRGMKPVTADMAVKKQTYLGLFMITLATLMYEILLTRIFSVTMWYHFAFMAISVAMFGMTVGAILVYLLPRRFTPQRAKYHLAVNSLLFAVFIVASFLVHLQIPPVDDASVLGQWPLVLTYVVIAIPFIFSGICVCLALTKFPGQVSRLYAADLAGAAIGCILLVYTLKITDGPTAVLVVALFAGIGGTLFATGEGRHLLLRVALVLTLLLAFFAVVNTVQVKKQRPLMRLKWVKGELESRPLYEKWNSFSRITVWGNPHKPEAPFGWGISPTYDPERKVRQLHMMIDASAYTPLTAFRGDLDEADYLKYDISNLAHHLRPGSKVFVAGSGGGRDVLSALAFEQESVLAVEINEEIIEAVNRRFGDFTGHLDSNPKVTFVADEARTYVAGHEDKFDIIQVSLIDTWAATASGAFVLTENSLYTVEAWKIFMQHLTSRGILTFTRWYFEHRPGEMYRLTSLASASLMQLGIEDPRKHMVIARRAGWQQATDEPDGLGTILVSREPFSDEDLDTLEQIAERMQFDVVLSPRVSADPAFATIASGRDLDEFMAEFPLNIAAPTDDSPFFFHMLRLKDVFNPALREQGVMSFNTKAVYVLGVLLISVIGLTFLCIIVPLILTTKKTALKGAFPLFVFFAAIGFGFMLVEISQMQRLIVFLGHPTYGLTTVLFALLLSSGLGSYLTQAIKNPGSARPAIALLILLGVLIAFGSLTPLAIHGFQGSTTTARILVAVCLLFPLGLFMGMPFPLGMKLASTRLASLTPWLWGINGATSVCASVIAVVIALNSGISASFWTGFACYAAALAAFIWASRRRG